VNIDMILMHVSPHLRAINLQRSMIFGVIVMNYENTHMKSLDVYVCMWM